MEVFFQKGRAAMTITSALDDTTAVSLTSSADGVTASANAYPMKGIWTTPDAVRNAPRVYK